MNVTEIESKLLERKSNIEKARAVYSRSETEKRSMTQDEARQFDAYMDAANTLQEEIKAGKLEAEKALYRKSLLESSEASLSQSRGRQLAPSNYVGTPSGDVTYRGRRVKLDANMARRNAEEYRAQYNAYLGDLSGRTEFGAALQTDVAEKGGYLSPVSMALEVIRTIDNTFWFRKLANVLPPTSSKSVSFPKRTSRMSRFVWGQELSPPTDDKGLKTGMYALTPHYMTGEIDVSNDLLQSAIVDIDQFVTAEIAWASGDTEEAAFFTGDGDDKPLGAFTPSDMGIPTSRDVSGAAITHDLLVTAKYSLRECYLRDQSLRWVGSRQFYSDCMKLKSTTGEPTYLPSLRDGQPDTLLGTQTVLSEYAPVGTGAAGAWASGNYFSCIGAWSNFDILDGLDMGIQRDISLMARQNQTVYIVRRKVDGAPRHGEAFTRLRMT